MDGAVDTRPTTEEYDRYIYLIELMKQHNYDEKALYEKFPFKIKDVQVSSILYAANKVLSHIADLIGEDAGEILEWMSRTERNFHKFFSFPSNSGSVNSDNLFYDYDLVIKDRIFK